MDYPDLPKMTICRQKWREQQAYLSGGWSVYPLRFWQPAPTLKKSYLFYITTFPAALHLIQTCIQKRQNTRPLPSK